LEDHYQPKDSRREDGNPLWYIHFSPFRTAPAAPKPAGFKAPELFSAFVAVG
jgi:hypothetical protein